MFTLRAHTGPVHSSIFTFNGNFFATTGLDNVINLWKSNLIFDSEKDLDLTLFNTSSILKPSNGLVNNNHSSQSLTIKDHGSSHAANDCSKPNQVNEQSRQYSSKNHFKASNDIDKEKIILALFNQIDSIAESMSILEQRITSLENIIKH